MAWILDIGFEYLFNSGRVYVQRIWLYIHEDRFGPYVFDDVDAGAKGHGGGDDAVAGANAQGCQGHVQGRCAGVECQDCRGADEGSELLLEASDLWPGGDPVRAQCVYQGMFSSANRAE